jgi:hypothetical protein
MSKKKKEDMPKQKGKRSTHKNKPIHIPLEFEKAVVGLMKVKPKKDQGST